ncbi:hypothetical protein M0R04_04295 [Candidatus Dojkabacteria bacterium]|jgi:hypothetical protein|nr:hypothetical protein [Candidatus Dojkabacteria bacterium]
MIPVVVCTLKSSKSYDVFKASLLAYNPNIPILTHFAYKGSFGADMNDALNDAFGIYDEVIIANDDIVVTPTSIETLLSDVRRLKTILQPHQLGLVATLSDNTRPSQNIRLKRHDQERLVYDRWESEYLIKESPVVAPIFAHFSKIAFTAAQFPPINWYSDDVICEDLKRLGFKNFVSTSYVHHVGASSIGTDYNKLSEDAMVWVREHRPEYVDDFEGRKYINKG